MENKVLRFIDYHEKSLTGSYGNRRNTKNLAMLAKVICVQEWHCKKSLGWEKEN